MAKRSHKSPANGKDDTGFIRAFISLFHFREGHASPKLITYGNHGKGSGCPKVKLDLLDSPNDKPDNVINDGSRSERVNMGKVSVKALMEEEMSQELQKKNIQSNQIQLTVSDFGGETHHKSQKRRSKKWEVISDPNINNFMAPASLDRSFPNNDLASFLAQLYNYNKKNQEIHVYSNNMINLSSALRAIGDKMHNNLDEPDSLLGQKQLTLRKALVDVAEAIASQTSVEKQHVEHRCIQSQELVNALEVLNSNKDLLLRLVLDPESLLLEHAQEFQDSHVGKFSKVDLVQYSEKIQLLEEEENGNSENHKESNSKALFQKQSKSSHFWKEDKPKGIKSLRDNHDSQSLNRIVVLKPNLARKQNSSIMTFASSAPQSQLYPRHEKEGKRALSFFSLNEIKRKLKRVFFENRKERHAVSMDGLLHRIPVGQKDQINKSKETAKEAIMMSSPNRSSHNNNDKISATLVNARGKNKKINPEECGLGIKNNVVSQTAGYSVYEEAKRHLVEMLDAGVQTESLSTDGISKSLGMLCFPEYSVSPISSPVRWTELSLSPKETGFYTLQQMMLEDKNNPVNPLRQNLEVTSCSSNDRNTEVSLKMESGNTNMQKGSDTTGELISAGSPEIVAEEGINSNKTKQLDALIPGSKNKEPDTANNRCNEEIAAVSGLVSCDDTSQLSTQPEMSPRLPVIEKSIPVESIIKRPERSPVSVLEPFFREDRLQIQAQQIDFEDSGNSSNVPTLLDAGTNLTTSCDDNESRSRYNEAAFEGLSGYEFSERCHLADQLLELSDEESSWHPLRDDWKLLLDCIDEVLVEMQKRYSKRTPTVSFIQSSIQPPLSGKSLVREVHKSIEGIIRLQLPNTLEQIVKKDLDSGSWMDLGIKVGDIVIKIWEAILDDLMEETVFDLWL